MKKMLVLISFVNLHTIHSSEATPPVDPLIINGSVRTDRLFTSQTRARIDNIHQVTITQLPQPRTSHVYHHQLDPQHSFMQQIIANMPGIIAMTLVRCGMDVVTIALSSAFGWIYHKMKSQEAQELEKLDQELRERSTIDKIQQQQHLTSSALIERIQNLHTMYESEKDESLRIILQAQIRQLKQQVCFSQPVHLTLEEQDRLQELQSAAAA